MLLPPCSFFRYLKRTRFFGSGAWPHRFHRRRLGRRPGSSYRHGIRRQVPAADRSYRYTLRLHSCIRRCDASGTGGGFGAIRRRRRRGVHRHARSSNDPRQTIPINTMSKTITIRRIPSVTERQEAIGSGERAIYPKAKRIKHTPASASE